MGKDAVATDGSHTLSLQRPDVVATFLEGASTYYMTGIDFDAGTCHLTRRAPTGALSERTVAVTDFLVWYRHYGDLRQVSHRPRADAPTTADSEDYVQIYRSLPPE